MIEYKNVELKYVEEAVALAISEYEEECKRCPGLIDADFERKIKNVIEAVFANKLGKVAISNQKLIGYMAFFGPWDEHFGNVRGVFSPLGGSAFSGQDRAKMASILFEKAADDMVKQGIYSYAFSRYAHDEEVGKSFVMNGFGIRCSDAILKLTDRKSEKLDHTKLEVVELKDTDKHQIRVLRQGLMRHMGSSPIFVPSQSDAIDEWLKREEIRVFAAKEQDQEKYIGYMALNEEGETFVSESDDMYNICAAYVDLEYRGKDVANILLEKLCQVSIADGKEYLGVDYETLNPTALRFWGKHFASYTYSYIRGLDERVAGWEESKG